MKLKRKMLICLLSLCLCIANMLNLSAVAVNAEDSTVATLEDVIAGLAAPSQLGKSSSKAVAVNTVISDGTYYLNGEYSGDYLRNDSSSVAAKSGTVSLLGTSIQWIITNVSGSFTIRSASDTTKYLAVPTSSTTNLSVQLKTVLGATIPTECLWNISVAVGGGCLIQNVYNSRYLYSYGNTVYTTDSLDDTDSWHYLTQVWRISDLELVSERELTSFTKFFPCELVLGYDDTIKYRKLPLNALWANANDFVYTGYNDSIITVDSNGKISPIAVGETVVLCQHKVTDQLFSVEVQVRDLNRITSISYWADVESNSVGCWLNDPNDLPTIYRRNLISDSTFYFETGFETAIATWEAAVEIDLVQTYSNADADIVAYGGTVSDFEMLGYEMPPYAVGSTEWESQYIGYYTYGNSAKTGVIMEHATIYILFKEGETVDEYRNTFTHELGHALGFLGHASSPSAVMYPYAHSSYTLNTAEANHLAQVYDWSIND